MQAAADLADEYESRRGERDDAPTEEAAEKGKAGTGKQGAGAGARKRADVSASG